ncbi:unnamed protein product, partial [Mesorhabditis belari]|uniref:Uncharacterized protein n=1 Tax=Mesorhabditis belari TaxID=2138241 RepID=A0AAF3EIY0_9BILA
MGRGKGSSVLPITTNVRADIEMLKKMFERTKRTRFDDFFAEFEALEFHKVYANHAKPEVLIEFTENLYQIALSYTNLDYTHLNAQKRREPMERPVGDRIFGCYLLFALFHAQPPKCKVPIHVTNQRLKQMRTLGEACLQKGNPDVQYSIEELKKIDAFKLIPYDKIKWDPETVTDFEHEYERLDDPDHYAVNPFENLAQIVEGESYKEVIKMLEDSSLGERFRNYLLAMKFLAETTLFSTDATSNAFDDTLLIKKCVAKRASKKRQRQK